MQQPRQAERTRPSAPDPADPWRAMRAGVRRQASGLRPPLTGGTDCCAVCRGPVRAGYVRCYQCVSHRAQAPDLLADIVVPVSYAVSGTRYADDLWRYKTVRTGCGIAEATASRAARVRLASLALVFLLEHERCLRRHAAGQPPTHVAVVPSGSGRSGQHPLRPLLTPYLAWPLVGLTVRPGAEPFGRSVDVARFVADRPLPGAHVVVVDDTWVSGASAQSAAAALKLSGARHVSVVVLGRHVNAADPDSASLLAASEPVPFDVDHCAVHDAPPSPAPIDKPDTIKQPSIREGVKIY